MSNYDIGYAITKNMKELKIDIHGLYVEDALERVRGFVERVPGDVERVVVVHGYNRGTALRDAIRTRLRSPRVRQVESSFFNDGETYLWLRK